VQSVGATKAWLTERAFSPPPGRISSFGFPYPGTGKALREEGFEVVLVNSNPAAIVTDPETAERTYVEPITPEFVARVSSGAQLSRRAHAPTADGGVSSRSATRAATRGGP
jgi:carbamoyl-phosphate synthase large subunit